MALLEKQGLLGGNSAWASSGVNGVDTSKVPEDSIESFTDDVVKSSQRPVTALVTTLTTEVRPCVRCLLYTSPSPRDRG